MDALEWALWGDDSGAEDEEARTGVAFPAAEDPATAQPSEPLGRDLPVERVSATPLSQPNHARTTLRRRKCEIARLRIAADYLEKCIAQLGAERSLHSQESGIPRQAVAAARAEAHVERVRLEQSQRENEELRQRLRAVQAMAHELQEGVAHHVAVLRDGIALNPPLPPFDVPVGEIPTSVLAGLLDSLYAMGLQTDAVFPDDGRYVTLVPNFTSVDVKIQRDANALVIELRGSRLVPFDIESTASAVWQNVQGRWERPLYGWVHQLPHETLLSHCVTYMETSGFKGQVRAILALRRVVEESRVVILRCSIYTHIHPGHRLPMNTRRLAWAVVGKPSHPSLQCHQGLSQVQLYSVTMPALCGGESEDEVEALASYFASVNKHASVDDHDKIVSCLLQRPSC